MHEGRLRRALRVLTILLVVAIALRFLYRSPYTASQMPYSPDEVEYAWCAKRLVTLGRYDVEVLGEAHPPWSSPWFSALFLAPVYWLAPDELGNAVWSVLALASVGVLAARAVGARVAGALGGAACVVALASNQEFVDVGRSILSDAPAAAIGLLAAWLYLAQRERPPGALGWLGAGALAALAFALRSVYLALLVPFGVRWLSSPPRKAAHLAALLAPTALVFLANALYQHAAFGDWRRNGYQYWSAVPYDYPELVVSAEYWRQNVALWRTPAGLAALALGLVGTLALLARRVERGRALLLFTALAAGPMTLLHLGYFFPVLRLQLFTIVLLLVIGGSGVAALLPERWRDAGWPAPALLAAALFLPRAPEPEPRWRIAADAIFAATPRDAVVVTALDPVYFDALSPADSERVPVPISRVVQYAMTVVTPSRVARPEPPPRGPFDHRCPGLLAGGAREAVPFTASEAPERLIELARAGRPLYLDLTSTVDRAATDRLLAEWFHARRLPRFPSLLKLVPRK